MYFVESHNKSRITLAVDNQSIKLVTLFFHIRTRHPYLSVTVYTVSLVWDSGLRSDDPLRTPV